MKFSLRQCTLRGALVVCAGLMGGSEAAAEPVPAPPPIQVLARTSDCPGEISATNQGPCHLAIFSAYERSSTYGALLFVEFETVVYAPPPDFDNVTFLSDTVCSVARFPWPIIRRAGNGIEVTARIEPIDCFGTPLPGAVTFVGRATPSAGELPTTPGSYPATASAIADGTLYRYSLFAALLVPSA